MVEGLGHDRYALDGQMASGGMATVFTPMCGEGDGFPAPVNSFPDGQSVYGLHDVAGNVWEWVFDGYAPYPSDVIEALAGPRTGEARGSHGVGYRCAR